jgi:leucine dehydrogenase
MTFSEMIESGHEKISFFHHEGTGLRCIVAIYDTRLGPAVGGTRMLDYGSEQEALRDVLRLSKAMAYKTAAAGFNAGGGKAVIIGDPETAKTDELLRRYGQAVDSMGGQFLTGEDMNITIEDVKVIGEETDFVGGTEIGEGAEVTAYGVVHAIEACLRERGGDGSVSDTEVLVQGCGKVGTPLVEELVERGADVKVSDIDDEVVATVETEYGVTSVDPEAVYSEPCDVFAPCATGGVINDRTIPALGCDIVAGSANNVLQEDRHADDLEERGIIYAPDYVINAGGLIAGMGELRGASLEEVYAHAEEIGDRLEKIFEIRREEGITSVAAANRYAEGQMDAGGESLIFSSGRISDGSNRNW